MTTKTKKLFIISFILTIFLISTVSFGLSTVRGESVTFEEKETYIEMMNKEGDTWYTFWHIEMDTDLDLNDYTIEMSYTHGQTAHSDGVRHGETDILFMRPNDDIAFDVHIEVIEDDEVIASEWVTEIYNAPKFHYVRMTEETDVYRNYCSDGSYTGSGYEQYYDDYVDTFDHDDYDGTADWLRDNDDYEVWWLFYEKDTGYEAEVQEARLPEYDDTGGEIERWFIENEELWGYPLEAVIIGGFGIVLIIFGGNDLAIWLGIVCLFLGILWGFYGIVFTDLVDFESWVDGIELILWSII